MHLALLFSPANMVHRHHVLAVPMVQHRHHCERGYRFGVRMSIAVKPEPWVTTHKFLAGLSFYAN